MEDKRSWLLAGAPEWFLAAAGFIYATGFLVVFTFFARLGIREVGGDFFKVKYVHVGILCLILPVLAGLSTLALSYMSHLESQRRTEGRTADVQIFFPSVILTLNLIATFYIYVMFSPEGYFRTRGHLIPLTFLVTLVGLTVIQQLSKKEFVLFIGRRADRIERLSADPHMIGSVLRWILCLLVIVFLDGYSLRGLGRDLWEIFGPKRRFAGGGGYVFLVLVFLILWLFGRLALKSAAFSDTKLRAAFWASGFSLIVATFYICILSFSYSVYPYIPAERGGGSYVDSSSVVLTFQGSPAVLPAGLLESGSRSKPLLIIEESGSAIYVADPSDSGGPVEWRRGAKPRITAIRREIVNSIEYVSPASY